MGQNSNNLFARMAKSEDGATAIIYALCMLPLILVAGFSIDLSRMISAERAPKLGD